MDAMFWDVKVTHCLLCKLYVKKLYKNGVIHFQRKITNILLLLLFPHTTLFDPLLYITALTGHSDLTLSLAVFAVII